jgi:hypothetical protein
MNHRWGKDAQPRRALEGLAGLTNHYKPVVTDDQLVVNAAGRARLRKTDVKAECALKVLDDSFSVLV